MIAAIDLKGVLYIDVCGNYRDEGVVPAFIQLSRELGIDVCETKTTVFEQAHMVLEK